MRVIAGSRKGRRLISCKGADLRPTSDRLKEMLFGHLGEAVVDAAVLDLFAGTGNLGIEALSRGAQWVTFVDCSREAVKIIRKNIELLDFNDRAEVVAVDAFKFLLRPKSSCTCFDLILADPPYNKNYELRILKYVSDSSILKKGGILVLQHGSQESLNEKIGRLSLNFQKSVGETSISIYQKGRS